MRVKQYIDYGVRRRLRLALGGRNSTRRRSTKTKKVRSSGEKQGTKFQQPRWRQGQNMPRPRVLLVRAIEKELAQQAAAAQVA